MSALLQASPPNLYVSDQERQQLSQQLADWPWLDLTPRQICDLELLMNGGFSPLIGFMGQTDYESVLSSMRLASGALWPIPVTLDVTEEFAAQLQVDSLLVLADLEGMPLAVLEVSDIWRPDLENEAQAVFSTVDELHPAVAHLRRHIKPVYVGGRIRGLRPVEHYDFNHYRHGPEQLAEHFAQLGWRQIVAFQTRNPMHRAHYELTVRAASQCDANLLLHPVVGQTKPGDVDHFTRVRCYQHLLKRYRESTVMLSLLPLAMRMGGPKEALWHALIRKNHGCTHMIVGRDHAGPGDDSQGRPFYGPYDAQNLLREYEQEIGISMVPFEEMVYVEDVDAYAPVGEVGKGQPVLRLSGTDLRRRLQRGSEVPAWFSYPEVIEELRRTNPPRHRQGLVVFFTGLSGAGKSAIAHALRIKLLEVGGRSVTMLDGDIVRKLLSSELTFSHEHRELNLRRITYVAQEVAKNGGIAICAAIAPYEQTRLEIRASLEAVGCYLEVFIDTSLEVCERRDRKGLYKKARRGLIKNFTGISDAYEAPQNPDLVLSGNEEKTPLELAQEILLKIDTLGLFGDGG